VPFAGVATGPKIEKLTQGLSTKARKILQERLIVMDEIGEEQALQDATALLHDLIPSDDREVLVVYPVTDLWENLTTQLLGCLHLVGLRFESPEDQQQALELLRAA
jgi:hypothetical protein